MVFDETYHPLGQNDSDSNRIILFCDIERPMRYRWAQAFNRWLGRTLMTAASSPNETGDQTGGINKLFRVVLACRPVPAPLQGLEPQRLLHRPRAADRRGRGMDHLRLNAAGVLEVPQVRHRSRAEIRAERKGHQPLCAVFGAGQRAIGLERLELVAQWEMVKVGCADLRLHVGIDDTRRQAHDTQAVGLI